jgi:hypothetical protein
VRAACIRLESIPCLPVCPISRHGSIPSSEFEFDRVLGPDASQSDVYHAAVKPIVEDVLNGWAPLPPAAVPLRAAAPAAP